MPAEELRHPTQGGEMSDIDVAQDDLADIFRAVGLSDSARPYSCHKAVHRDLLPRLEMLWKLVDAASIVADYDCSDNDDDFVEAVENMRKITRKIKG
jgi:hypothetical protein